MSRYRLAVVGMAMALVLSCAMSAAAAADSARFNLAPSGTSVWYTESVSGVGYGQVNIQIPAWKEFPGTAIYFQEIGNIARSIAITIDTRAGNFFFEQKHDYAYIYPPAFGNIGNFGQLPRETVSISP